MAFIAKTRAIDTPSGFIRTADREAFDRRAAVAVPNASGGAPPQHQNSPVQEGALQWWDSREKASAEAKARSAALVSSNPANWPSEKAAEAIDVWAKGNAVAAANGEDTVQPTAQPRAKVPDILHGLATGSLLGKQYKPMEDYSLGNEELINRLATHFKNKLDVDPALAARWAKVFQSPYEMALRVVATMQRTAETLQQPGVPLPMAIERSRGAKRVLDILGRSGF